jgi:hypothetical protein
MVLFFPLQLERKETFIYYDCIIFFYGVWLFFLNDSSFPFLPDLPRLHPLVMFLRSYVLLNWKSGDINAKISSDRGEYMLNNSSYS